MSDPTVPSTPIPRRRRLSPSLRAMMVLVLVIGLPIGWKARRASLQRRAIAAVRRLGGEVEFDYRMGKKHHDAPWPRPPGPTWLREWVGDEYFREVGQVTFRAWPREGVSDPSSVNGLMEVVEGFDQLTCLNLAKGRLTRSGLERVARFPRLTRLEFEADGLGDDDLGLIAGLGRLQALKIRNFPDGKKRLTGLGLAHLSGMVDMTSLSIEGIELVHPDDLAPIATMTLMETLAIDRSPRDEACMAHLRGFKYLRELTLVGTEIGDAGIKNLAGMTWLNEVHLDGGKLTDAGLADLSDHVDLQIVEFRNLTALSGEGLARLCKLPELRRLALLGSRVDGSILARVSSAGMLGELDLSDSTLTDAGLEKPPRGLHLMDLNLSGTKVTDLGLRHLSDAFGPALLRLDLSRTVVTDAGLRHLSGLDNLTLLRLKGTKVTKAGVDSVALWPKRRLTLLPAKVQVEWD